MESQSSQRSLEWHRARLGRFCGSEVGKLMTKPKNKSDLISKTAMTYVMKIVAERLLNPKVVADDTLFQQYLDYIGFSNRYMDFGTEMESVARNHFCSKRLVSMEETGSIVHPKYDFFASSPDGLFYEDGKKFVWENKTVNPTTYIEYVSTVNDWESLRKVNSDYFWQLNAELSTNEADCVSFSLFSPFMSEPMFTVDLERNNEYIEELEEAVVTANRIANEIVSKYNG